MWLLSVEKQEMLFTKLKAANPRSVPWHLKKDYSSETGYQHLSVIQTTDAPTLFLHLKFETEGEFSF